MLKITIITATWNSEKYLEDTIKSVLQQTYENYEYLIIDGESNDGTIELIKKYEPLFKGKMHWISEKDRGMYDAINKGIRMATGNIIGIINSDDFFHRTDVLEKVNDAFSIDKKIQAIYGDIRFVNSNNIKKTTRYYSCKNWRLWRFRIGIMPAHPSYYTYKDNFDKYGYYSLDYEIAADFELLVRHMYVHKVPARYLPIDFMKMRKGGKSTRGIRSKWILVKEDLRALRENGIWSCMPMVCCKYLFKISEYIKTRND